MSDSPEVRSHQDRASEVFEIIVRLGIVFLLLAWGLMIVAPFLHPIAWGVILAVALYPAFRRISNALGGKPNVAGALFILVAFAVVIVPVSYLAAGSVEGAQTLATRWQDGDLRVPVPPEGVRELALIGEPVYAAWLEASTNLESLAERFSPQLMVAGGWLLALAASTGGTLILLTFSILIGGVLMMQAENGVRVAKALATRLVGDEGEEFLHLTTMTIRGVAMGVIGTAAIQAAAAALGFVLMKIPLAGLWAALVLILAIVQLPPMLVLVPIAIWSFSSYDTAPATIFTVWCLLVAASDNVLKPILMGRGLDVPMLVLIVGSLGGMILSGIMGLFVGAVVLAVIYRLFGAWLNLPAPVPVGE